MGIKLISCWNTEIELHVSVKFTWKVWHKTPMLSPSCRSAVLDYDEKNLELKHDTEIELPVSSKFTGKMQMIQTVTFGVQSLYSVYRQY